MEYSRSRRKTQAGGRRGNEPREESVHKLIKKHKRIKKVEQNNQKASVSHGKELKKREKRETEMH